MYLAIEKIYWVLEKRGAILKIWLQGFKSTVN